MLMAHYEKKRTLPTHENFYFALMTENLSTEPGKIENCKQLYLQFIQTHK